MEIQIKEGGRRPDEVCPLGGRDAVTLPGPQAHATGFMEML
jgi:hypothetical protein